MEATTFIYDDILSSDFGLYICKFGEASGLENVTVGSQLEFNLSSVPGSDRITSYGTSYSETLMTTFQVGKFSKMTEEIEPITPNELSSYMRWLNRKDGFHEFKILQDGYENLYTEASFNATKLELCGKVIGLELTLTTLYPYLLEKQSPINIDITTANQNFVLYDQSDEIGHIYPNMEITCKANGNLIIQNTIENRSMRISNCVQGEKITIDGKNKIISSSISSHKIQNDFNFVFFRIANTYEDRKNTISVSIPCSIKLDFEIIRKVGF